MQENMILHYIYKFKYNGSLFILHCAIIKPSRYGLDWSEDLGKDKLKIGELAKLAGVSNRTIDYYTSLGLLEFERNQSNYRIYPHTMVDRIKEIELYKKQGEHLNDIKQKYVQHEVIDIQDLRLKISQLENDISNIAISKNLEQAKSLAKKDLALIKALLLFIHQ